MKWLIVSANADGTPRQRNSDWYPRISEGPTAEEAVWNMFKPARFKPAGQRYFLAVAMRGSDAVVVTAAPRQDFDLSSELYHAVQDESRPENDF